MNKNSVIFGVLGIFVGLAIGFFGANALNRKTATDKQNTSAAAPLTNPQSPQTGTNPAGMLADVQATLDKAKSEPENFDAQQKAGEMYSKIRRFDTALEFYEKAQKIKPNDFSANSALGNAYFDLKQYEKAQTAYANALEINPKDVAVRTDYGLTFYLHEPGDTDRAISEYRKSLKIDSNHELTLQNLIVALNEKGQNEEAAKALATLKGVNPENDLVKKFDSGAKK